MGHSEGQTIPNKIGLVSERLPLPGPGVPWEILGRFGAVGPGGAPRTHYALPLKLPTPAI